MRCTRPATYSSRTRGGRLRTAKSVHSNLIRLKRIALARRITLAVAESLTVGRLQALVGSVSGASAFFKGGITAYGLDQKVRLLGVDQAHARTTNCVSRRVAREMAKGVAGMMRADVTLATTGYAEPDPRHGVKTPFAYCAFWDGYTTAVVRIDGKDMGRMAMQQHVADCAIDLAMNCLAAR
jgi:nicotinamide-nucleotide amidase